MYQGRANSKMSRFYDLKYGLGRRVNRDPLLNPNGYIAVRLVPDVVTSASQVGFALTNQTFLVKRPEVGKADLFG